MKNKTVFIFILLSLCATGADASTEMCPTDGITAIYINGILSDGYMSAADDRDAIRDLYVAKHKDKKTNFQIGYNPSRGMVLDVTKAIMQSFLTDAYILDSDLHTIVRSLKDTVKTDKIVIIGHSQGAFYANALYMYLLAHGVPQESVVVYAIATPASEVAGYGFYYTSTTDKLINTVRNVQLTSTLGLKAALPGNFTVTLSAEENASPYGGHSLRNVYLKSADGVILYDINESVHRVASGAPRSECIPQPDPMVVSLVDAVRLTLNTTTRVISFLLHAIPTSGLTYVPESALPRAADTRTVSTRTIPAVQPTAQKKNPTRVTISVTPIQTKWNAVDSVAQTVQSATTVQPQPAPVLTQQESKEQTSYVLVASAAMPILPQPLSFGSGMGGGGAPAVNVSVDETNHIGEQDGEDPEMVFDHLPDISIESNACIRLDPCVVKAGDIPIAVSVRDGVLVGGATETIIFNASGGEHVVTVSAENNVGVATAAFTIAAYVDPVQVQYAYGLYPQEVEANATLQFLVVNNTRYDLSNLSVTSPFGSSSIPTLSPDEIYSVEFVQEPRHTFFDSLTTEEGNVLYTLFLDGSALYNAEARVAPFVDGYM